MGTGKAKVETLPGKPTVEKRTEKETEQKETNIHHEINDARAEIKQFKNRKIQREA